MLLALCLTCLPTVWAAASLGDLTRAQTMVPRTQFKASNFHSMLGVLNAQLENMSGLNTAACADFTANELQELQAQMFPQADPGLLKAYKQPFADASLASQGRVRQTDELTQLREQWAHLNEAATQHPRLHDVYRDGLCHETVMWYVHHLSFEAREALKASITLPLLPLAQHQEQEVHEQVAPADVNVNDVARVFHAYQTAASCGSCHVSGQRSKPAAAVPGAPAMPIWGGALAYNVSVLMTAHDVIPTGANWTFQYHYDMTGSDKLSRYDHPNGHEDEVCTAVYKNTKACSIIFSNTVTYLIQDSQCCTCKLSGGFGAVLSDWMTGGTYQGQSTQDGLLTDEWLKAGASDNHYYVTADAQQRPVRYMEHKNGLLKSWDFDLSTWKVGPQSSAVFTPPGSCTTSCQASFCR